MAGTAIGAGLGVISGLVNHNQKLGQYNRDKQLAADIERNSSWTGVHGDMPKSPGSAFGSALGGGLGGALMGQQFGGAEASGGAAAAAGASDPSMAGGYNLTGKAGGMAGGADPFGQGSMYTGSSWAPKATLFGLR